MRYVTEMDNRNGHWLVLDVSNNQIVGDHVSATLAALDAIKREEDSLMEEATARIRRRTAALEEDKRGPRRERTSYRYNQRTPSVA